MLRVDVKLNITDADLWEAVALTNVQGNCETDADIDHLNYAAVTVLMKNLNIKVTPTKKRSKK